jgi:Ni/Co efflux regulator RcnB
MKTSAILCAVLAGTMGVSTLASAQQWEGRHDRGGEQRQEQRGQNWGHEQRDQRWAQGGYEQRGGRDYGRVYNEPRYAYNGPAYYGHGGRYYRGGYLPREYLNGGYYVNWQAYPGLYAPPYGYQWVNVGGEILLVALATGLIANLMVQ